MALFGHFFHSIDYINSFSSISKIVIMQPKKAQNFIISLILTIFAD